MDKFRVELQIWMIADSLAVEKQSFLIFVSPMSQNGLPIRLVIVKSSRDGSRI